jgi:hypothetical protein
MDNIYLVKYSGGSYDDYYNVIVFATTKKSKATKYCAKFNRILKKWKEYYSQYEEDKYGWKWIYKEEYINQYFNRWYKLKNINKCNYEKIPVR